MKPEEALAFIHSANQFGSKLGLDNIRKLTGRLGNPQDSLRFVHVAGTNGKGSVASMIASVLQHAGYRTGLYTSPYIYSFQERMRIDGQSIPEQELAAVVGRVKAAVEQMVADGETHPTEFELVTAAAFCWFAQRGCDVVVLEVGLGGRFDATNVIGTPALSVICSIGLDHTEYLGDTYGQIAMEKCGIVKPGGHTVCYPYQRAEAMETVRRICAERGNALTLPEPDRLAVRHCGLDGSVFDYGSYDGLRIRLVGRHQIGNCITAVAALEQLARRGLPWEREALYSGLAGAVWHGRLECISETPCVIVDGAHNPDGMKTLADAVRSLLGGRRVTLVMGMLADKNYVDCIREIGPLVDRVLFTTVDNPRAATGAELFRAGAQWCRHAEAVEPPSAAVQRAMAEAGDGVVICAGSLYMLGDVRRAVQAFAQRA